MMGALTDEQWSVLAPLIETCRPHHKTQHRDLCWTIEAMFRRSLPAELGPLVDGRPDAHLAFGGLLTAGPLEIGSADGWWESLMYGSTC